MIVIIGLWLGAGFSHGAAAEEVPVFDGEAALEHLTAQCDLGPRPPGSKALGDLRTMIHDLAREHGLSATNLCFEAVSPMTGENVELCNIVVSAGPAGGERLWLGAHYDTRPVADQDPDPAHRDQPILGANDGASGVAVLMHLIEILGAQPPPAGVDLIFFDGEDSGVTGDPRTFCLGSARLAATWRDFGSPLANGTPTGLIVLDMVGREGLVVHQEYYSLRGAPDLTRRVFERAAILGLGAFVPDRGPAVFDDHVPFLETGIPAVDLIDFDYPQWHTLADTPDACSAESLRQVGVLVTNLIYRP
jgi:hypothetical protein